MRTRHFPSFASLADALHRDAGRTFTHRWQNASYRDSMPMPLRRWLPAGLDLPGRAGVTEAPKYLYRGEPGTFPSSLSSRGRLARLGRFGTHELELLDQLTKMAHEVTDARVVDSFRALGWPQHYGFPTACLDLTSDPTVALHFAASSAEDPSPRKRVVYRLDLEAIERKVYGSAGRQTPLAAACIDHLYFTRARRQRAWVLAANRKGQRFDFRRSWHLWWHLEAFIVDADDANDFIRPELLGAQDDAFAAWPLAIVRALKIRAGGGLPRTLAEWICGRIPLFEWTPVDISYNDFGVGAELDLLSPTRASELDGRSYAADPAKVIEELVSPDLPVPNGIVFGTPTGGRPGTSRRVTAGSLVEVQWLVGIPGPGPPSAAHWRTMPMMLERVVLR